MNEGARIESDETSKISLTIGVIVALAAIGGVVYFAMFAHSVKRQLTGFDPNRPVPDDATLRKRLSVDAYHVVRENGFESRWGPMLGRSRKQNSGSQKSTSQRAFQLG